ncbi:MAG: MBOAT family protein [Planctomycetes bacterium]|nr:MBOAT family protein [Planctomycetota bacterium]
MTFNAYPFFIFLAIVFPLYWLLPRRGQNLLVTISSFVFYGWWDWHFLPLLWFSTVIDYAAGLGIERSTSERKRKAWLAVSLVTQLGMLFVFKYLDFGITSMQSLLESLGFRPNLATLGLILPVGISFYTFQTLSYTIDVYRRQLRATHDLVEFSAFVTFFPQLVAGPIERAANLLGQFQRKRTFDSALAADGCRQMLYGLFLKTVVGDNCARVVERAFDMSQFEHVSGWTLLFAAYLFAFQIYGDFAGYSHIAIGCARLFGFDLMRNFAYPYLSRSPAEFWHRWHISLSTWFRDYVYIPLGGGRVSPVRRRWNVFVTFVLSGIWHGAGFGFLFWGVIHGACVALQWWPAGTKIDAPCGRGLVPKAKDLLQVALTFHLVCAAWVFFRSPTATVAVEVLGRIGGSIGDASWAQFTTALLRYPEPVVSIFALVAVLMAIEWVQRNRPHGLVMERMPRAARWCIYFTTAFAIMTFGRVEQVPFIYFQF